MRKAGAAYVLTILEIMEDKAPFMISRWFYCIMIMIVFHQDAGYFFSTYERTALDEPKAAFIAHLNEISPGTFLLYYKGNDQLTLIVFVIMQILSYSYFTYVGVLTYLKKKSSGKRKLHSFLKKYKETKSGERSQSQQYIQSSKSASQTNENKQNDNDTSEPENDQHNSQSKLIKGINQILNVFFTFYYWVFFTPFVEINSGVFVCGGNSFLIQYRDNADLCDGKPLLLRIFPVIGLALTLTTGFIVVYLFRSYEFHDQNLLKRRFYISLFFQLLCRFFLIFCYYLNISVSLVTKHILASCLGVLAIYDSVSSISFSDKTVALFFGCAATVFEISVVLCHLWIFTNDMPAREFFYYFVILSVAISGAVVQTMKTNMEGAMRMNHNNYSRLYKKTDFYLEEFVRMILEGRKDEYCKFKLEEIIIFHQLECNDPSCYCHSQDMKVLPEKQLLSGDPARTTTTFTTLFADKSEKYSQKADQLSAKANKSKTAEQTHPKRSQSQNKQPGTAQNMLSEKELKDRAFKLVDSIFKWALASPQLQHDTSEFEHLSLKYISYLAKYRQNTFRAYYELKALLFGRLGVSFYFKMISKIMSRSIETQIKQEEMMNHSKDEKDDLPVWVVWKMDSLKERFVPAIARALESKNEFWRGLQNGFIKMEDCVEFCEKQSTILRSLNQAFESELNELEHQVKHTFVYFKILSIFELLIHSQPTPAAKYDKICHELIKRDVSISANGLNNSSIANKQIATIVISFSKNPGSIISKIPNSLRTIFKFTKGDSLTLRNVNQLMPKIIGSVHNELLMNSNNRGAPSPYVGTTKASSKNISSFCVDKQGFLFAVKTFIGNSFGHADDFCFVGSVLKVQNNLEYMLFNQTGQIQGISQMLFKRLFQSKNTAFTMALSELLKSGYAFLFCQQILQSIREDIDSEILGDQLASGIIRRASINVTSNFGSVFKRFHNFLEIKKTQPNILDYSAMKQLLNDFSRMKLRRQSSHNSSHYKNSNQNIVHSDAHLHAWWIGLTYSLRYQEIKYQEGTKSIQLFHLAVQDISEETQDNPKSVNQSQDASQTEYDFSNTKTSYKVSQTTLTDGFSIGEFAAAAAAQNQNSPGLQQRESLEVQRYRDRLLKGQKEDENNSISKQSLRQHTIESLSQNARINQQKINQGLFHRESSTRDMSDSKALSFVHELINEQSKQNAVGVVNNNDNLDIEGGVADPGIESSLKNSMSQSIHKKYQGIGGQSASALADYKKKTTGGIFTQNDLLTQGQLIQGNNNSQTTNNFTTNNFFQTYQINTEDEQEYQYQQQQQQIPLFDYIHETQLENQIAENQEAMQYNTTAAGFFQTDRDANYSVPTTRRDNQQADESDRIVNAALDTESKQPEIKDFIGNNDIFNKNYIYNVEQLINNHKNEEHMKRINFPIFNNEADIQDINQINGFQENNPAEQNNPNADEQKILRNALNSSNSMKSQSMDFANTQNIQRLKQGKGQNLEDQRSIGSHQSRASRTGQEFIKDILNRNNLPIAAKMYFQVMGLIVMILLGSVLWSAIFISIEIKGLSGDLDQLIAFSDIDVAFKRCLVGGIKSNVARLYASTNLVTSTEELAIAKADITAAVGVFSKYLQQLQEEFEGYSADLAIFDSEQLKQTMLLKQNGFVLLQLSNEEVLQMSYNSDLQVVSSAVRSFLFMSQNYFTFSELTQQLRLADSSRITSDLDTIDMMTYISAIVSTLLCIGVALAGYPLVSRISNYKEKIVLLVSRISAVEIETEIEKQKECISQLTSSEETFLTNDFFEIVYERKRRRLGQEVKITPRRAQQFVTQMKRDEIDQINQQIHTQQQEQEQLDNGNNNNKIIQELGQQSQQLQGWQNELSLVRKEQSEVILTQESNIKERSNQFKDAYDQQTNRDNNLPSSSYRLQSNSLLMAFPKKKVDFKVNLSSQGQQLQQQELQSFSAARLPQQQLYELSEMQNNSPQNMLFRSPTYSQSQQLDRQEPQGVVINKLAANKQSKLSESPQILPTQQPPIHRISRTTRGLSQSSLGGVSINTGSTNIPGKHPKTTRKPNSSNYVSSRITEQKLSIAREYIIIGISGFLSGVFFCSLMAYTLLSRSQITTALSLVFNTLSARSAITGYFTDSDILGGYDYLLAANSMVLSEKQLTRSMLFTHLGLQMKELTQYSSETSEIIVKLSSNDYSSILKQLFESDLCTGFASCSSSQFSYCQRPSDCGDYTTGISGIISQSLDVYSSYASTLSSLTSPAASDAIDYMHSAKHLKSISEGFLTPDQVFSLFAQIAISAASNIIDKIANVRIIVYSVVGPMLLSMVAGIFYYHWKSLKRTLLSLNYLLVVIPSDKLSEEITLHVLKAIKAA